MTDLSTGKDINISFSIIFATKELKREIFNPEVKKNAHRETLSVLRVQ